MFNEMVLYHSILVDSLLLVVIIGYIIPFLSQNCKTTIRRLRIYMFIFHGVITTVAFSGLVAFTFAKMALNLNIVLMVLVYISTTTIESLRYLKFKKSCRENRYSLINILILIALIGWEYAVSIP